ncbi:MAG: pilus assembly protein TadG-related protein [Armatimonadetes bacterium]|nr:pilus assembly protein TadG-related protein [Armatimonadota bacterium]
MRKGQTVILLALAMVVLLIVAGFAIDSGRLYRVRHILQNAADAGALAGAQVLARGTRTTQRAIWEAINQKIQMNLALNNITGSSVIRAYLRNDAGTEWEITNTNSNQPPPLANRVRVEIRRPEVVLFGRFLGQTSANVGASAQAQFGILRTLPPFSNIVPIAIHYEIVANANEGDMVVVWDGYQVTVRRSDGGFDSYGTSPTPLFGMVEFGMDS